LRCYRITVAPLVIYTALLWGAGLMGGYLWAYQDTALGLSWISRPAVDTFWITSTLALATVSVLFGALILRVARAPHCPM
jgi:MATE family multidrug resistance protein